ncbi:MAG: archaeosortase/exosortase family protein [Candidatus Hydrogenedentes bacterium]|nr:archaeosortase/exosortase family protein [Candidatus Hydrogenedentota bacterium]
MPEVVHQPSPEPSHRKVSRRRTVSFVLVFMVTVLVLLTGYRYTIQSVVNDWYLFQVARHTTWVLDLVGYRATLEEQKLAPRPEEARATMKAWEKGLERAEPAAVNEESPVPLSRWERYRYRILSGRRVRYGGAIGPRVSFVLSPGLLVRIHDLDERAAELGAQPDADPREGALAAVREELQRLREEQERLPKGLESRGALIGKTFTFIVIPECGAFEVMAIFLAAVIGFPTSLRKRLLGLLLGMPVLYVVNIMRLSCLAVIGALSGSGEWFDFAHNYVWQAIYIVFVVAVWLAWVEYIVKRNGRWQRREPAAA